MSMRIAVFGLGYVGAVTAACLAKDGHQVIGVDVAGDKVESINNGRSPIVERDVERIIDEAVSAGRLKATTNTDEAIAASEIAIVCVGTPSSGNSSNTISSFHVDRYSVNICRNSGADFSASASTTRACIDALST